MWHTIAILGGFFGLILFGLLTLAAFDDNNLILGSLFLILTLGCISVVIISGINLYEERIETVTTTSMFVDTDHIPSAGFLNENNTEYRYSSNEFVFEQNKTYKVKVQHNNDNGFNIILYKYT